MLNNNPGRASWLQITVRAELQFRSTLKMYLLHTNMILLFTQTPRSATASVKGCKKESRSITGSYCTVISVTCLLICLFPCWKTPFITMIKMYVLYLVNSTLYLQWYVMIMVLTNDEFLFLVVQRTGIHHLSSTWRKEQLLWFYKQKGSLL